MGHNSDLGSDLASPHVLSTLGGVRRNLSPDQSLETAPIHSANFSVQYCRLMCYHTVEGKTRTHTSTRPRAHTHTTQACEQCLGEAVEVWWLTRPHTLLIHKHTQQYRCTVTGHGCTQREQEGNLRGGTGCTAPSCLEDCTTTHTHTAVTHTNTHSSHTHKTD